MRVSKNAFCAPKNSNIIFLSLVERTEKNSAIHAAFAFAAARNSFLPFGVSRTSDARERLLSSGTRLIHDVSSGSISADQRVIETGLVAGS